MNDGSYSVVEDALIPAQIFHSVIDTFFPGVAYTLHGIATNITP